MNIGIGDLEAMDDHSDAPDDIGDKRLLADAVAVPEGVPVEENVPGYGVPINGKEEVDAETTKRAEETRVCIIHGGAAVGSRPDQIRSEIVRDVPAKTHLAAQIDSGVGISHGDSHVGNAVESETSRISGLHRPPLALKVNVQHGFVVELMCPALGITRTDTVVDRLLAVLRIGMASDNADVEFKGVHLTLALAVEPQSRYVIPA
jgi:hypothetical protein